LLPWQKILIRTEIQASRRNRQSVSMSNSHPPPVTLHHEDGVSAPNRPIHLGTGATNLILDIHDSSIF
jgi:hypothetical protein